MKTSDIRLLHARLTSLRLTTMEMFELVQHLKFQISQNRPLNAETLECLKVILDQSVNIPKFWQDHLKSKRTRVAAERELEKKGPDETRLRRALEAHDLSIKSIKMSRKLQMRNLYELLIKTEGTRLSTRKWRLDYSHNSKSYPLEWGNLTEKKAAIIEFLKKEFYDDTVSRNAVIQQLRRSGAKNAPGLTC